MASYSACKIREGMNQAFPPLYDLSAAELCLDSNLNKPAKLISFFYEALYVCSKQAEMKHCVKMLNSQNNEIFPQ